MIRSALKASNLRREPPRLKLRTDTIPPTPTPHNPTPVNERRRAAALAGHQGDEDSAREFLADGAASVRAAALGALYRLGHLDTGALQAALADSDPDVKVAALELAGRDVHSGVLGQAINMLGDTDPRVVEVAAWTTGELASQGSSDREKGRESDKGQENVTAQAVAELRRIAGQHDDALCRESAVAALGAIGATAGLPTILDALNDKPAVRRRAVISLAPFEGPDVDAALERARGDHDRQVREAVEELVGPAVPPENHP